MIIARIVGRVLNHLCIFNLIYYYSLTSIWYIVNPEYQIGWKSFQVCATDPEGSSAAGGTKNYESIAKREPY